MLELLGLNEFGERLWRAVAVHRYSDLELLAGWLGEPVDTVRAEIEAQLERGLIRRVGDRWVAQDPVVLLQAEHARRQAELAAAAKAMADEREALFRSGLFSDYLAGRRRAGTGGGGVEVVEHSEAGPRIAELTHRASVSLQFLLTGQNQFPGLNSKDMIDMIMRAGERGVHLASVWSPDLVDAVRRAAGGRRPPALGWVRQSPNLPTRLIIWDGRVAMVPLDATDLARGGMFVTAPALLAVLTDLFARVHREAEVPAPPTSGDDDEPADSRRPMKVLLLLSKGLTDEAIATRLEISGRTVKRVVAQLCEEYQVRSRFQLGVVAARNGLIPMSDT
ncbi:helix-turn-helix transcriptional regulator [Frankia sp. CNm7]|uniref:Helix-turn-helix transcriptional regulator n=1 Tax=Frankia nepalensis TaxID=1836974 RepID=A0A937RTJ4_9ACTN|nr:helix-turn-helix transcriptional regulator [Frankia nepalensis]MBL7494966.1 helix-turn-helix transcriptional regulator [Frankia nepalensis]MBL7514589.1 helix-turn-helix transcriptional regulator [Frankia nepalensis]MBL7523825.1 helix-turn-helix transcriptional regulator [Frankia nepalensis]MBL7633084.1 helix-turn-helix transcriptional regulator [Frankia nepalensis]